jgi:hypothetical protein
VPVDAAVAAGSLVGGTDYSEKSDIHITIPLGLIRWCYDDPLKTTNTMETPTNGEDDDGCLVMMMHALECLDSLLVNS